MKLDLNCDLGERERLSVTKKLFSLVTSANVATGGYGGEFVKVYICLRLAKHFRARLGVHPGLVRKGAGRGSVRLEPGDLRELLQKQVGAMDQWMRVLKLRLHHVKLHGALYHATEADPRVAREYLSTVRREWPQCIVYALAGGTVHKLAERSGVQVWPEAFVDRGYLDDGSLVPRGRVRALLTTEAQVRRRMEELIDSGSVTSVTGKTLRLNPKTICLHADTPGALRFARIAREMLDAS